MQDTFSIILLALVDGEPRMLTLKQALRVYLEHRITVIKRRAEFDLDKARQRAHILEGLTIALKHLDEIINLIRNSPDVETARERLMKRYKLSELQANAILEMQLRRLAALERRKIETEYKETLALIKELEGLLKSPKRMRAVAAEELLRVKADYGDKRRTHIVSLKGGKEGKTFLTTAELLPEQMVWVSLNGDGLICRTHDDKPPRLSGSDAPWLLVRAQTTDILYLASERGLAAAVAVHTLPEADKPAEGALFNKVCPLKESDLPVAAFAVPTKRSDLPEEACVLTVTKGGMVKKSLIGELPGASAQTFTLVKVNEGDALGWVTLTGGQKEVLLATALGMAIRFKEDEVRPMGLVAAGVNSIKLGVGDEVVGCEILPGDGDLFAVASDGKAKRMAIKDFPVQGRYGRGVILWDMPAGVRLAGLAFGKVNAVVTLHLLKAAAKQSRLDEAPLRKRSATRGEAVVDVKPGDSVIGVTSGWAFSRFIEANPSVTNDKPKSNPNGKKSQPAPKTKPAKKKKTR
jgi:DNA gyrase subunit A